MKARASCALTASKLCKAIAMATVILGCLSLPALAEPITYDLTGATLCAEATPSCGDSLTGRFTVDESTDTLSGLQIYSSYFDLIFTIPTGLGAEAIQVGTTSGPELLTLTFPRDLADFPEAFNPYGTYLPDGFSNESSAYAVAVSGEVDPTPLPATLPLFVTGLGALGLLGWRRKRKNGAALAAA
jgi:hypothetical protein